MGKIWWSEMELFQRLLTLRRNSERARAEERRRHEAERAELIARIDELSERLAAMRSRGSVAADPAADERASSGRDLAIGELERSAGSFVSRGSAADL